MEYTTHGMNLGIHHGAYYGLKHIVEAHVIIAMGNYRGLFNIHYGIRVCPTRGGMGYHTGVHHGGIFAIVIHMGHPMQQGMGRVEITTFSRFDLIRLGSGLGLL